ncbi:MAG: tRNA (adenosine(37)-N6)-threonylcarbamoyltransferase complex ATPase subunit type 1 TsaE [Bdellovibrionales bacterium]
MNQEVQIKSIAQLEALAQKVALRLERKQMLLISGTLGAGKTTFVRAMAKALGAPDASSPTYAIHQRYEGTKRTIDHVDLYRLEDAHDLESSGFWDLFNREEGLVVVEWADRLDESAWPRDWACLKLHFSFSESSGRRVVLAD